MIVVTFKLQGKPVSQLEVKQSLQSIAEKVKKLDGCNDTEIYQHIDDDDTFFMVEKWDKQRQLDDHMKTSLFSALLGIKILLVKKPEIMFMKEN